MQSPANLKNKLEASLPPDALAFMQKAAATAGSRNEKLYLVGGAVRDLLLGLKSWDIDLTVEGDAIELAEKLASPESRVTPHPRFSTAKIELPDGICVDIARTRKETYTRPGALPAVSPGVLTDDLFRRDFTINAMAIALNPEHYGELVDYYSGLYDLEHRLIRVLHDESFANDATRIWRAIRYGERLDFAIEEHTLGLLKRDISYLDTISGDRIRYELECVFGEDCPEKAIQKAGELGVLSKLNSHLCGNGILAVRFRRARDLSQPQKPPFALYVALFSYPLPAQEAEQLISYLRLNKITNRVLRDAGELRGKVSFLDDPALTPAQVYHLLYGFRPLAIEAVYIESNSMMAWQYIDFYANVLCKIKPYLSGKDLQQLGVPEGPEIKETLEMLLDARLNGETQNRENEEKLVKKWLAEKM